MSKKTVYIIDDESQSLGFVEALTDEAGLASKAFSNPLDFLEYHDASHDGCIVLDINMPEMNGLELQGKMNEIGCMLPIIFITGYGNVSTAVEAMKAGAVDFLEKPYDGDSLIKSILDAFDYDKKNSFSNESLEERMSTLTPREHEVMNMLAQKNSNKDIARVLDISPRTVEVHRQHIMKKLKIKSVLELPEL